MDRFEDPAPYSNLKQVHMQNTLYLRFVTIGVQNALGSPRRFLNSSARPIRQHIATYRACTIVMVCSDPHSSSWIEFYSLFIFTTTLKTCHTCQLVFG